MNKLLLLTFLDVLETRNFNRTADRLNITQSSVSGRIRQLEAELGVRLFERGRGGADPTPAGRRFEPQCRSLLTMWGQAVKDAAIGGNYDGALRISVQYSLIRSLLIGWSQDLRRAMPSLVLQLEVDYSAQIMRDLSAGNIDLGIVYSPQYLPDLSIENIGAEEYVMISTRTTLMEEVKPEEYIRVGYTPGFEKQHDARLPHLSHPPPDGWLRRLGSRIADDVRRIHLRCSLCGRRHDQPAQWHHVGRGCAPHLSAGVFRGALSQT